MAHLADTNILARYINVNDHHHLLVGDAVYSMLVRGETLCYTQQSRREFWNVCTRPVSVNGLGFTRGRDRAAPCGSGCCLPAAA